MQIRQQPEGKIGAPLSQGHCTAGSEDEGEPGEAFSPDLLRRSMRAAGIQGAQNSREGQDFGRVRREKL